jgi:hypothetical protein
VAVTNIEIPAATTIRRTQRGVSRVGLSGSI